MNRRPALTALAALTIAALGMFPVAARAQTPRYSVRNLGPLISNSEADSVTAMSSDGSKVVGTANYPSRNTTATNAFYWDGTMHDMGGLSTTHTDVTPFSVTPTGLVLFRGSPAAVWTLAVGKVLLPFTATPGGGRVANAMNDSGVVAGFCDNPDGLLGYNSAGNPLYAPIGVRWARDVTSQWTFMQLPPLAGHNSSTAGWGANSIDQSGNMIGKSWIMSVDASGSWIVTDPHIVLWSPSDGFVPHDLGAAPFAEARDSRTNAVTLQTQFIWNFQLRTFYSSPTTASTTELLGSGAANPRSAAVGVNVLGQVAGVANFAGGSHAFYWDTTFPSGVVMDLGVLSGMTGSTPYHDPPANVINDGGFVVGTSSGSTSKAFLSTPASRATSAKLLDLNTLLTNTLSGAGLSSLTGGYAINNSGFILCNAYSVAVKGSVYQRVAILTRVQ